MNLINDLTVSVFFMALSACIVLSLQFVRIYQLKKIISHKDRQINKISSLKANDLVNEFLDVLSSPNVYKIFEEIKQEIKTKNEKAVH